jgi:type I restriction enzyme S subunit
MMPDGFKETEIGPIPVDWEVGPLGQAAECKKATLNPQSHPDEMFDYYSIPAYQESDKPALERGSEIRSQKLLVEPGMVLFGKLNPRVPKVWRVTLSSPRRKIASTEFIPLLPIEGRTSSEFLCYLAWSDYLLPKSQELVSGSTPSRQRVDVKAFLRLPVPLPSLPEQRRIARVLGTIQQAIAAQDDLIAAAREVKRSLMQRLFTYGPGPEPAPTKETEVGEIPEHWDVVQLGDVTESSAFGPRFSGELYDESGNVAALRTTDLDADGNINYSTMPQARIQSERFQKHFLQPGDFLVTRSGTCGIAAVFASYQIPVLPGAFLIRFRLRGEMTSTRTWGERESQC